MRSTDHRTDGRRRERRTCGLRGMFVLAALGLAVAMEGVLAVSEATDLFVSSTFTHSVLEYDGTTGAFVRAFVPNGSGGLFLPSSLTFGPGATPTPSVPEPSTWLLLGSGLACLAVWRRKKAA